MRITSSEIGMESSRYYHSYMARNTTTLTMVGTKGLLGEPGNSANKSKNGEEETDIFGRPRGENTFEDRKDSLKKKLGELSSYSEVRQLSHLKKERGGNSTVRDKCMEYLVAIFFGEAKKWDYTELSVSSGQSRGMVGAMVTETLYFHQETYYEEREETSFQTTGTVRTADGREIDIRLNVDMSRSFSAYYEENYAQIQTRMCDPLVINLEGNMAELTDQTFFFDIDADGKEDEISTLAKGSGYLALDRNGDGVINDGNELFGSKSGDGFADLAAYDSDGNGWIDENDEIWKKLLIWTKDEDGKDKCYKLSEKNVGAIGLSNASTDFSLNSSENMPNGRIRKTGIFLYENGWAGTVQHLDVAKHDKYA